LLVDSPTRRAVETPEAKMEMTGIISTGMRRDKAMKRVLVADDDAPIREMLQLLLESEGYEVVTVRDGAEAIDFLTTTEHEWAVLLDVMMPRMSGPEVCARLQQSPGRGRRHKVALMTAGPLEKCQCPAARTILRKPFKLNTLLDVVAALTAASDESAHQAVA
jgi:CheY-like chemotaxis protein